MYLRARPTVGAFRARRRAVGAQRRWLIAAVAAAALAFRFYQLDALPGEFYGDTAIMYEQVDRVLRGDLSLYFYLSNGPLYFWVIAPLIALLGQQGFMPYKLASVLISLVGIWLTYLFVKEITNRRVALLAGFVLAASSWYVVFSRLGVAQSLIPAVVAASYYFLASGVRRGSFRRVLGGLGVSSLGLYLMAQTLVLPLAYLLSAAFLLPRRRLALLVAATGPILLPFALVARGQAELFFSPTGYIGGKALAHPDPLARIAENVWGSLLMFHVHGDVVFRSNPPGQPQLDPISGIFMLIGGLYWLRHAREVWLPMLLVPLAILQLPANLVLNEVTPTPSASRTIGILPFVAFAVAGGLWVAVRALRGARLRGALVLGVAGLVLASNWARYFGDYAWGLPDHNTPFGKIIADTIDALPPETAVIVYSCCWGERGQPELQGIQYVLRRPRPVQFVQRGAFSCALLRDRQGPLYVVWDPRDVAAELRPATCNPRATEETRVSQYGTIIFIGYSVPP